MLIEHTLSLKINTVLMDREYLDSDVMNTVDSMKLKYIIPTKDNNKVKKYRKMLFIRTHYDRDRVSD